MDEGTHCAPSACRGGALLVPSRLGRSKRGPDRGEEVLRHEEE